MEYDWVSEQIQDHEHKDAVKCIVQRHQQEIYDAGHRKGILPPSLPCGHDASFADEQDGKAICRACDGEVRYIALTVQNHALQKALKAIANHGSGLPRTVAQLALKELDRA